MNERARFNNFVKKSPGCWKWTGATDSAGYGAMRVGGTLDGTRGMKKAHRIAWVLKHGPIPKGMCVCHKCDNPSCVRPGHLFLGTYSDNMNDMLAKGRGRHRRGERHGRAKLTERDVHAIRARYASGDVTQEALAAEYGVTHVLIGKIVRHKLWTHI